MATPEQIAIWQGWLANCELALQTLTVKGGTVSVQYGDRRTQYSELSRSALLNQIARLKAMIAGKRPGVGRINYVTPV
jgi:hypothetical protein